MKVDHYKLVINDISAHYSDGFTAMDAFSNWSDEPLPLLQLLMKIKYPTVQKYERVKKCNTSSTSDKFNSEISQPDDKNDKRDFVRVV